MDVNLGQHPTDEHAKDAIHVAVVPMVANEKLAPGQDVGLVGDGRVGASDKPIGVVDPFMTRMVFPDQKLWLVLYPNTVTGMRHEWEHPAFGKSKADEKRDAEEWLRDQCGTLGVGFEDLVGDDSDLVCGEYILSSTNEAGRDHWYDISDEFWIRHEIYTGRKTLESNRGGFTCSC